MDTVEPDESGVYECPECHSRLASDRPIRLHHRDDSSHEVEYIDRTRDRLNSARYQQGGMNA